MNDTARDKKDDDLLIASKHIWKSFETGDNFTTVLKDLSVNIKKDELVILFGPSGCGKTTFLNTVMGLEHPDKGRVNFMGMDLWDLDSDDRALLRKSNIGIIHQQQNWIKAINVLENVALVGSLLGYSKEQSVNLAKEKLKLVGMTHRANYRPYELSSGEQQRISLARSLMGEPSIIVADEPTGNLDVKAGIKVINTLRDLADGGKAVLMVTHALESLEFADRILFMIDGKIMKDIKVSKENIDEIKRRITEDIELFIKGAENSEEVVVPNAPKPEKYIEHLDDNKTKTKKILDLIWFNIVFTFAMFLLLVLFVPAYILERFCFKKCNFSSKAKDIIMKVFNKLEGEKNRIEKSISSWALGEISLSHLMEKKARTLITILGVGVGIGFITFLLSIGYGLEKLVIGEIAEIEEMRQVYVNPVVGGEVVIDEERFNLISDVNGVEEAHPLVNVATRVFFQDSQTDIVAHGVHSEYVEVSREVFLRGENFDESRKEVVLGNELLPLLGMEASEVVGEKVSLEFIPINWEREATEVDDDVAGAYDKKVEYLVSGVVSHPASPVIFFPIEDAHDLGLDSYSEVLVVLGENTDMAAVRRDIERLGMKTSSIMDTVSQIETFFSFLRLGLGVFGTIAFIIAVLGMINTLTVSLMERTREVGLLKSIGMKSDEVRKLFITESMLIAFFGGVAGVILGILLGVVVSIIISAISVSRGGEYLIISRVPLFFVFAIVLASVIIGFVTGLYPSRRAVRMSPLDALRYE